MTDVPSPSSAPTLAADGAPPQQQCATPPLVAARPPPCTAVYGVHRPDSSIFKRGGMKREAPGSKLAALVTGEEAGAAPALPPAAAHADAGAVDLDDAAILKEKLDAMHAAWAAPRGSRDMTLAFWRPVARAAPIGPPRCKLLPRMGVTHRGRVSLHPEEAAFLVDRGDAALVVGGGDTGGGGGAGGGPAAAPLPDLGEPAPGASRVASAQEAATLAAAAGVPASAARAFSALMRAGFIVRRAPSLWGLPPDAPPGDGWVGPGWGGKEGDLAAAGVRPAPLPPPPPAARPTTLDLDPDLRPPRAKRARTEPPPAVDAAPPPSSRQWWPAMADPATPLPRLTVVAPGELPCPTPPTKRPHTPRPRPPPPPGLPFLKPFPETPFDASEGSAAPLATTPGFDVYRCCSSFARRRPAPVATLVKSTGGARAPPSLQVLRAVDAAAPPGAPVRWALASGGAGVAFFGLHRVRLGDV